MRLIASPALNSQLMHRADAGPALGCCGVRTGEPASRCHIFNKGFTTHVINHSYYDDDDKDNYLYYYYISISIIVQSVWYACYLEHVVTHLFVYYGLPD